MFGICVLIELFVYVMGVEYNMSECELYKNVEVLCCYGIFYMCDYQNVECVEFDNSLLCEFLLCEVLLDDVFVCKMYYCVVEVKIYYYQCYGQVVLLLEIVEYW